MRSRTIYHMCLLFACIGAALRCASCGMQLSPTGRSGFVAWPAACVAYLAAPGSVLTERLPKLRISNVGGGCVPVRLCTRENSAASESLRVLRCLIARARYVHYCVNVQGKIESNINESLTTRPTPITAVSLATTRQYSSSSDRLLTHLKEHPNQQAHP